MAIYHLLFAKSRIGNILISVITFEPIKIYTQLTPQKDHLHLSFVKDEKMTRNGQKWQLGRAGWGGYY